VVDECAQGPKQLKEAGRNQIGWRFHRQAGTSAAEADLFFEIYIAVETATHKDFRALAWGWIF
jgi:hypothetical protein